MYYWPELMLQYGRVDHRLAQLPPGRTAAFATACAQHALLRFEQVWPQTHFRPSTSSFISTMLEIVEALWDLIPQIERLPDLSGLVRKVDLIVGPDYAKEVTWNGGELLNATLQALECLREGGSPRRAALAAKSAYNAVSKWYCAKAYPGKAMKAAQITDFEKQNPECQAEFSFQLGCLSFLERGVEPILSYTLIEEQTSVEAWIERSAAGLRSAGDDRAAIIAVFERFIDEGMALVHSPSALWDYVSTVIARAGFDGSRWDRRMRIYSTVSNQRFQAGRPYGPDWPWNEEGGD
jgi:hypothetical protein